MCCFRLIVQMQYICWINHLPGARARYAPQRLFWPEWSWQQVRKNFSSSVLQFQAHHSQPPLATALPGLVSSKSWKHRLLRPLSRTTVSAGCSLYLRVSFLTGKHAAIVLWDLQAFYGTIDLDTLAAFLVWRPDSARDRSFRSRSGLLAPNLPERRTGVKYTKQADNTQSVHNTAVRTHLSRRQCSSSPH